MYVDVANKTMNSSPA